MPKIRKAARAVIVDGEKTAVIQVENGEYYKIPGGGVEEGESDEQAAEREASEEAGCKVELLGKIGEYDFKEAETDTIHTSVCYLAKIAGDKQDPGFEEHEKERKFKLIWVTFEEAYKLFEGADPGDEFKKNINSRDLWFLKKGEMANREILNGLKLDNLKIK